MVVKGALFLILIISLFTNDGKDSKALILFNLTNDKSSLIQS